MFYGYDVKNDSAELMIASEVFTSALSPVSNDVNNEATTLIGKIMVMGQAAVVKQTAKKTWTDMASRGGIPLLLTQLRALAHKICADSASKGRGKKGLEKIAIVVPWWYKLMSVNGSDTACRKKSFYGMAGCQWMRDFTETTAEGGSGYGIREISKWE